MDKDYLMLGRRIGKTYLAKMQLDFALDNGKTVYFCTPEGITRRKRKKHLTLIEEIKKF